MKFKGIQYFNTVWRNKDAGVGVIRNTVMLRGWWLDIYWEGHSHAEFKFPLILLQGLHLFFMEEDTDLNSLILSSCSAFFSFLCRREACSLCKSYCFFKEKDFFIFQSLFHGHNRNRFWSLPAGNSMFACVEEFYKTLGQDLSGFIPKYCLLLKFSSLKKKSRKAFGVWS